jgi:hypothetical protein
MEENLFFENDRVEHNESYSQNAHLNKVANAECGRRKHQNKVVVILSIFAFLIYCILFVLIHIKDFRPATAINDLGSSKYDDTFITDNRLSELNWTNIAAIDTRRELIHEVYFDFTTWSNQYPEDKFIMNTKITDAFLNWVQFKYGKSKKVKYKSVICSLQMLIGREIDRNLRVQQLLATSEDVNELLKIQNQSPISKSLIDSINSNAKMKAEYELKQFFEHISDMRKWRFEDDLKENIPIGLAIGLAVFIIGRLIIYRGNKKNLLLCYLCYLIALFTLLTICNFGWDTGLWPFCGLSPYEYYDWFDFMVYSVSPAIIYLLIWLSKGISKEDNF